MANHKWGKLYRDKDCMRGVWRQRCEKCGYVRGAIYPKMSSSTPRYFVIGGAYEAKIPPCPVTGPVLVDRSKQCGAHNCGAASCAQENRPTETTCKQCGCLTCTLATDCRAFNDARVKSKGG